MKKVKVVAGAVLGVLAAPEFRPFEIRLARAVVVAVVGALSVKYGVKVA